MRLALGATRGQLIRHLLTESLLLSVAGGAAGCVLAWWAIRSLGAIDLPIGVDLSLDYRVLAFAVAISLVTGVPFGLAPALKATRVDLLSTLRDDGEARSTDGRWFTLKNALVVFQVAVSVVLLAATSVFLQMMLAARAQRTGFAVDGVAMLETDARYAGYSATRSRSVYEELRRRVAAIPGVQSAVLTRGPADADQRPAGRLRGARRGRGAVVVAGSSGRARASSRRCAFRSSSAARSTSAIAPARHASRSSAKAWPGSISAASMPSAAASASIRTPNWIEVIGVARDTGTADLQGDLVDPTPHCSTDRPHSRICRPTTVVARTSLDAAGLVGAMQRELRAVDVALPVVSAQDDGAAPRGFAARPAAVAAFLGALGMLGLRLAGDRPLCRVAFAVSRRSREIGIRMALGARSQEVARDVVREVAVLLAVGAGAGAALATVVILAMRSLNSPTIGFVAFSPRIDPLALVAIAGFIVSIGMAAAFVPARRAASMNPLSALRHE